MKQNIKVLGKVSITVEGDWDETKDYDKLCIVNNRGYTYMSKCSVPKGTSISDTNYWFPIGSQGNQGTTDYNVLENKPMINGVVIEGDVDGAALGIKANVEIVDNLTSTSKDKALSANQGRLLSSKITSITNNINTITETVNNKATKSTTLAGYGITNAYTKTETNNAIATAIGEIPEASQSKAGLMSAKDKIKLDGLTGAYIQIVTLANYKAMEAAGTLDENTVYHIKG